MGDNDRPASEYVAPFEAFCGLPLPDGQRCNRLWGSHGQQHVGECHHYDEDDFSHQWAEA